MAESLSKRIARILSGKVEDAVDRMELSGSDSVMRETIREVDRSIDEIQGQYEALVTRRLQAARQQKLLREKAAELTDKAKFALGEGREDLAEAALTRQVEFEDQAKGLDAVQESSASEEARLSENLTALKSRKQQMEAALENFTAARRDAALGGDGPTRVERDVERRVDQAEAAFDRAMTGAGGVGFQRGDAETINRVAEIDTMHKHSLVAARLAELKKDAA